MLHGSIPLPVVNGLSSADIGVSVQAFNANLATLAASSDLLGLVNGTGGAFNGTINLNGEVFVGGALQPTELDASQLPTANPAEAGRVWSDNGTLKVSSG